MLTLLLHREGQSILSYTFLDLVMTMLLNQRMYEIHQQYSQDDRLYHLKCLDSLIYMPIKLIDQSNLIFSSYKKWNISTMNNKHLEASKVFH